MLFKYAYLSSGENLGGCGDNVGEPQFGHFSFSVYNEHLGHFFSIDFNLSASKYHK